jgi:hypothetical protein
LPSLRCHAGVLAITRSPSVIHKVRVWATSLLRTSLRSLLLRSRQRGGLLLRVLLIPKSLLTCHASSSTFQR